MIEWIKDHSHLERVQKKDKGLFVLAFYGDFSANAKRALVELENFSRESKEIPVFIVDVGKVKDVHKQFDVKNVPTVLMIQNGKIAKRIEGIESASFYNRIFFGINSFSKKGAGKKVSHRVVVYSGPGCPACGTAKAYLRKCGIAFREIDISRDQHAAEKLIQRSGQMAVPQIDIDGHLVVGFNQAKIDQLLAN